MPADIKITKSCVSMQSLRQESWKAIPVSKVVCPQAKIFLRKGGRKGSILPLLAFDLSPQVFCPSNGPA